MGPHTAPQPAPGLAEPPSREEGIGLDPVFQIWSHLWDVDLNGEEDRYYNMTKVISTPPQQLQAQMQCTCNLYPAGQLWSYGVSGQLLQHDQM